MTPGSNPQAILGSANPERIDDQDCNITDDEDAECSATASDYTVERADFIEPSEGANIVMKSASLMRAGR